MKFKLGAAIGFVAGYVAATKASQESRQKVDDTINRIRENPRVQHVSDVVTRDAKRIGDAVEHRLADSADHAAKTVVSTVAPSSEEGGDGKSTGPSASNSPPRSTASGTSL
jgi:gas vesicle protein